MTPYAYQTSGRNRATLITVFAVWAILGLAILWLDAAPWLMGLFALATIPALIDLISGRASGLRLDVDGMHWFSGRRTGEVAWPRISHIRLDTRLDFSIRASAVLTSGRKVRLPLEATPPSDDFEEALTSRGIKVERHHFSLLG
ncbi:hypothetical protein [uncultured Tateyamaria sp.]|uniref:hypothetical protein n=1 Tax=Tateyamaria sp. 1078 TaxID=3417464 RepID=UPI00263A0B15|nr:hypothetical protein [uncultured Tateyamaria sp.]